MMARGQSSRQLGMYGAVSVVVATQYDHHGGRPVDDLGGVNERTFKNASRSSSSRPPG